jgi:hypothetical protein
VGFSRGLRQTYVLDEHEALSVGDDLGGIQSLLKVVNELLLVALELGLGALEEAAGADTLALEGRKATSKDRLADQSDGHAQVKSVDGSPLAGTLLTSLVKNLVNHGGAILVVEVQDITGDLDKERVQDTLVPLGENVGDFLGGKLKTVLQDVISLVVIRVSQRPQP